MSVADTLFAGIDGGVETLFSVPNIALWFASGLLLWCGAIVAWNGLSRHRPFARALARRLEATAFVDEADAPRLAFAEALGAVDAALAARDPGGAGLRHAWLQYRDTFLDPDEVPLRATVRPEEFFLHLGEGTRVLAWWANIFVAVGLTFTFLGIVAALLKAVQAMGASADPATMQAALVGLLHITAAKFWTSIGGVLSSIVLRVVDRGWHARIAADLQRLCDRLEAGVGYASPQRLAADQLAELRRQGERAGSAADLGPATARLAALLDGLDGRLGAAVTQASGGIDAALRRTVEAGEAQADTLAAAGDEVRALLATLARVVGELGGAFAPMRDAAAATARAVETIHDTLETARRHSLASDEQVRAIVAGIEATSTAATRAWEGYAERFDAVDAALAGALDQVRRASTEHAGMLTGQVGRVDAALAQAVDRLSGALGVIGELVAVLDDMRGEIAAGRR